MSRLDIETSSIFICQNYQMSRHCCGHAVAQQASAKTTVLQQEGEHTVSKQRHHGPVYPNECKYAADTWRLSECDAATHNCTLNTAGGEDASHVYNLPITQKHKNMALARFLKTAAWRSELCCLMRVA